MIPMTPGSLTVLAMVVGLLCLWVACLAWAVVMCVMKVVSRQAEHVRDLARYFQDLHTRLAEAEVAGRKDRERLRALGVDGFFLPRTDEHGSEYLPPSAERTAWLTGFTGSAAQVLVLADKAAVFSDGRYTVQLAQEVNERLFERRHIINGNRQAVIALPDEHGWNVP